LFVRSRVLTCHTTLSRDVLILFQKLIFADAVYETVGLVFTATSMLEAYKLKCKDNGQSFREEFEVCQTMSLFII